MHPKGDLVRREDSVGETPTAATETVAVPGKSLMIGAPRKGSGDLDLNLPGFGFLILDQMHAEQAVFELGADLGWTDSIREREAAAESAVGAHDSVIFFAGHLLLEFAFTGDGQRAFLRRDLGVETELANGRFRSRVQSFNP